VTHCSVHCWLYKTDLISSEFLPVYVRSSSSLFRTTPCAVLKIGSDFSCTSAENYILLAIMPLAALYFGVIFLKGRFSLKNWSQKVILRHDTSSFKRTCFLTRLKVLLGGLNVSNGLPYIIAVLNNNWKQTVGIENTQKRLAQRSFLFNILSAIHSQDLKF
jgi:hypothetical protein